MEIASKDQQFQITQFGGLDAQHAPLQVAPNALNKMNGLYPAQIGSLSRIPGKLFMHRFSSPIISIHQTNDVNNNIIIQTATTWEMVTLNSLLGR